MLSKRLKTIADMVDKDYHVIDVGCDHALLDIYLTLNKKIKCTAIDNKKSVLEYSKKNIENYKLDGKINLILNDGLDNIKIDSNDLVILAGLGTNTILKIIKNKNISNLIVQSNDDLYTLRKELVKNGFKIADENIIYEKKFYIVIKFVREKFKYNKKELLYGPVLLRKNSKVFVKYLNEKKEHLEMLFKTIPNKFIFKKINLLFEIRRIKAILK